MRIAGVRKTADVRQGVDAHNSGRQRAGPYRRLGRPGGSQGAANFADIFISSRSCGLLDSSISQFSFPFFQGDDLGVVPCFPGLAMSLPDWPPIVFGARVY